MHWTRGIRVIGAYFLFACQGRSIVVAVGSCITLWHGRSRTIHDVIQASAVPHVASCGRTMSSTRVIGAQLRNTRRIRSVPRILASLEHGASKIRESGAGLVFAC